MGTTAMIGTIGLAGLAVILSAVATFAYKHNRGKEPVWLFGGLAVACVEIISMRTLEGAIITVTIAAIFDVIILSLGTHDKVGLPSVGMFSVTALMMVMVGTTHASNGAARNQHLATVNSWLVGHGYNSVLEYVSHGDIQYVVSTPVDRSSCVTNIALEHVDSNGEHGSTRVVRVSGCNVP